ncbi:hypothetical protein GEMRC1_006511 [Eukaryota sp. GEM-RC1]
MLTHLPDDLLNVLIISDIHDSISAIDSLAGKLQDTVIDFCILCGDILDLDHNINIDLLPEYDARLSQFLSAISSMTSSVVYVLGNHDPILHSRLPASENILRQCVHKKRVELLPGLSFVGVGGSVPSYVGNSLFYDGHPYTDESAFASDLSDALRLVSGDDQFILVTHSGPEGSTTLDVNESNIIQMGSKSLSDVVIQYNKSMLANVHGHSHGCRGLRTVGECSVINPGALKDGNASIMKLERNDRWSVVDVEFFKVF